MNLLKTTAARLFTLLAVLGGLLLITEMTAPGLAAWIYAMIEAGYRRM